MSVNNKALRGEYSEQTPLLRYNSWRVGGMAERLYKPYDCADLSDFLKNLAPAEPLTWLGLGSNVLIRDGGIKGTVIITQGRLDGLAAVDAVTVRAEAGVSCAKVARFCAKLGLTGVEFLAGVPGTIGGALAMNAGAFGSETWDYVSSVETMDRQGATHQRLPKDYELGYRSVKAPAEEWFIAAYFKCERGDAQTSINTINDFLKRRAATQPTNEPSCGSVFRNPPKDFAARLIEACALKGTRKGDACVSEKHANFIVNKGAATAADIEALIEEVAATVYAKQQVKLIKEVKILGEP